MEEGEKDNTYLSANNTELHQMLNRSCWLPISFGASARTMDPSACCLTTPFSRRSVKQSAANLFWEASSVADCSYFSSYVIFSSFSCATAYERSSISTCSLISAWVLRRFDPAFNRWADMPFEVLMLTEDSKALAISGSKSMSRSYLTASSSLRCWMHCLTQAWNGSPTMV